MRWRVPPAAFVVGSATALASCVGMAIHLPGTANPLPLAIVTAIVVGAVFGLLATVETRLVLREAPVVRQTIAGHRRAALAALGFTLFVALVLLLTRVLSGVAAAVAAHVASAGLEVLLSGVTVTIATWGRLRSRRARRWRRVAVVLSVLYAVELYFDFQHVAAATTIYLFGYLFELAVVVLLVTAREFDPDFGPTVMALAIMTVVHLAPLRHASTATIAHWAAEVAIAASVGSASAVLAWRRFRTAGPRLRRLAGLFATLLLGYVLFLLFTDELLGGTAEAALFPLAVWLSLRLWRWMSAHRRILIRAAADLTLALLLGTVLVSFLVWLANLLDLPDAEVAVLRALATSIGNAIDLPWWLWAGVYLVLAALYLIPALGPPTYQRLAVRVARLRLVPTANVLERGLNGAGIGLMLVALLGLAAPPSVGAVLSARIRDRVAVDTNRRAEAEAETAVYRSVLARFNEPTARLPVLVEMLIEIHKDSPPAKGDDKATPAELDLAHRMGELQARVLLAEQRVSGGEVPESSSDETAAEQAELNQPLDDAADMTERLNTEQHESKLARSREKQADTAAELAAASLTKALDSLTLGRGEILGLVREYLDGIAESPLRDTFFAWIKHGQDSHAPGGPPSATDVVEPNAPALALAADEQLMDEMATTGNLVGTDPVQQDAEHESPIDAAVNLAHETQHVQQTGHCAGCEHLPEPDEHGGNHDEIEIHGE